MTATSAPKAATSFSAITAIMITVALDMLAAGLIYPLLPRLVESLGAPKSSEAALVLGVFGSGWMLLQIVVNPLQGWISDRYGRRPVILLSNLGLGIDYLFMSLAPNLAWLAVGRLISSLMAASYTAASAYIVDVSPQDRRAANLGLIGGAAGLGAVVGPALGGALGAIDLRVPFWVAAGLSLANFVYALVVLKEPVRPVTSLPGDAEATSAARKAWRQMLLARHMPAWLTSRFLRHLANTSTVTLLVIFAYERFAMGPVAVGLLLTSAGITRIVTAAFVGPVVKAFGQRATMLGGIALQIVSLMGVAWAPDVPLLVVFSSLYSLGVIGNSAEQSFIVALVGHDSQGRLAGVLASIYSIAGFVGPLLFSGVFVFALNRGRHILPLGAPFIVAGTLTVMSLILAIGLSRKSNLRAEAADA